MKSTDLIQSKLYNRAGDILESRADSGYNNIKDVYNALRLSAPYRGVTGTEMSITINCEEYKRYKVINYGASFKRIL